MKKTYEEILAFDRAAGAYLKRQGEKESKLAYAVRRVAKSYGRGMQKAKESYDERLQDIDIEHASEDERGILIVQNDSYVYTKEAQRRRLAAQRTALRELLASQVEFEPHFTAQPPDDLPEEVREAFAGFVVREEAAEESKA